MLGFIKPDDENRFLFTFIINFCRYLVVRHGAAVGERS